MEYCVNGEEIHSGYELMQIGIITSDYSSGLLKAGREKQGDYMSRLYHLKAVDIL